MTPEATPSQSGPARAISGGPGCSAKAADDASKVIDQMLDALLSARGGLCSAAIKDGTLEMVSAAIEAAEKYQSTR